MLKIALGEEKLVTQAGMRAPHLFKLKNGDILLIFHVDPDMCFARRIAMRSTDNGQTWQRDHDRSWREFAHGELSDGTVLAFERDTFEKEQGLYFGSYFKSMDGGKNFSGPHFAEVRINRVCATLYPDSPDHYPPEDHTHRKFYRPIPDYYRPVIERASTRAGFSFWRYFLEEDGMLYGMMKGHYFGDKFSRTVWVVSKDKGQIWNFVSDVAYESEFGHDGMTEPVFRRVADGSLLCLMRRGTNHRIAQTRSVDGGLTWSQPERLVARGVDPDLCVMSDGTLAATYGRPGQYIMFSEDKCGYAWGYHTAITECRGSAMTGVVELEPGKLLVVYDVVKGDLPEDGRNFDKCEIRSRIVKVERT